MSVRILSAVDVQKTVDSFTSAELISMASTLFQRLSSQDSGIITSHRLSIPTDSLTTLYMPSHVPSIGTAVKVVSVPRTGDGGLPATTVVLDEETGRVKGVVNARKLTALRNAAGSTLASTLLANPESKCLTAFGAGAQIEEHVLLLARSFDSLSKCTIVNRSHNARLSNLMERLSAKLPHLQLLALVSEEGHREVEQAVRQADVIVTATSSTTPLFPSAWVKNGAHLNLIGSYTPKMHEIDTDLVRRATRVVVDKKDACMKEAGEIITAQLGEDDLVELGQVVANADVVEELKKGEVTIFKSVGVGAQDVQIACAVLQRGEEMGLGTVIEDYD